VAYEGIVKLLKPNMEWEDPYPFLLMLGAEKKYIYTYGITSFVALKEESYIQYEHNTSGLFQW